MALEWSLSPICSVQPSCSAIPQWHSWYQKDPKDFTAHWLRGCSVQLSCLASPQGHFWANDVTDCWLRVRSVHLSCSAISQWHSRDQKYPKDVTNYWLRVRSVHLSCSAIPQWHSWDQKDHKDHKDVTDYWLRGCSLYLNPSADLSIQWLMSCSGILIWETESKECSSKMQMSILKQGQAKSDPNNQIAWTLPKLWIEWIWNKMNLFYSFQESLQHSHIC